MKTFYMIVLMLILAGCSKPYVNFTVITPRIKTGSFIVYGDDGNAIYGGNIKNGELQLQHQYLRQPGYYTFKIIDSEKQDDQQPAEIYLEPGDYVIKQTNLKDYPGIISTSAVQQELTAYHRLESALITKRAKKVNRYRKLQDNSENISKEDYNLLCDTIAHLNIDFNNAQRDALIAFTLKYPKSISSAHIMANLNYEQDAEAFYKLFKTLSPEAKNTDDGKDLAERLAALQQLLPGHTAPDIEGQTPDGKTFNKSSLDKKIYLVEFWKAGSTMTRANHLDYKMALMMSQITHKEEFGLIGVSLDHKRDWWLDAIKVDHLTWPQYSDLKGNNSNNLDNWQITILPAYFLIDKHWHIIESNIEIEHVIPTVNSYLAQH